MQHTDISKMVFVPFDIATTPPSGLIEHLKNMYWVVHPEKGVLYYKAYGKYESPQCNSNESITKRFVESYPECEVRLMPSVFRRIDIKDYM